MSRLNSQRSKARPPGPSTPAWEQQQQHQQHHTTTNNRRTINLFTGTSPPTSQEIVNTFELERYSRHNPTATTTTTANANANFGSSSGSSTHRRPSTSFRNNNNNAQTQMSTFGGVSPSPHPLPPSPSHLATNNSNRNNNYNTMSTASDSRSWSVSTTSTVVAGVGSGPPLLETKEQSNWIHLSTPNYHLTLSLKLSFRPQTQADLDNCRPLLLIQAGNEVLESLGLDHATIRSSKLRGVVKGSMIGFRYTSSSSPSASSSLAPAPGSSLSESHKFQIKFKTLADCGQCSSLLLSWIECLSVAPQGSSSTQFATTAITTTATSASTSSQTLVQCSQETEVTRAPPSLPAPSPYLAQACNNNSNVMRSGGTQSWSQQAGTGVTTGTPSPPSYSTSSPQSPAPAPVSISIHVSSEDLAQILRSAAANSAVLPHTTPTTASMSSPPQYQHQRQQQCNRQARLSITPQFASQSTSMAMPMPVTSTSSFMVASGLTARMSSVTPSDCGGQYLQPSVGASCQQRNIEIHEDSFHNNINVNNNDGISISTTSDDGLSALLNLPNAKLQDDIDNILHDPLFQDMLIKVDQLLRSPVSKR